jgi:hypothetical protein
MDDVAAIMEAIGSKRAALLGYSDRKDSPIVIRTPIDDERGS